MLSLAVTVGCAPASTSPGAGIATSTTGSEEAIDTANSMVSGVVIGGGDTTPPGLADAPRNFVYDVEMEDGEVIKVAYTAYPPSPLADRDRGNIRLEFHQGTVMIGDYLIAGGSYDPDTSLFMIAEEGDFIETYPEKP